jgi:hypothetical protein
MHPARTWKINVSHLNILVLKLVWRSHLNTVLLKLVSMSQHIKLILVWHNRGKIKTRFASIIRTTILSSSPMEGDLYSKYNNVISPTEWTLQGDKMFCHSWGYTAACREGGSTAAVLEACGHVRWWEWFKSLDNEVSGLQSLHFHVNLNTT